MLSLNFTCYVEGLLHTFTALIIPHLIKWKHTRMMILGEDINPKKEKGTKGAFLIN
ncbi:hypothetical protein AOR13_4034 [Alteromonas stellipolaris LMG 21856]|nr:hypothetical protein AOR13_4034 [Alteromonas stellipolaris LMG 21856]